MTRSLTTILLCGVTLVALGACDKKATETKSETTITESTTPMGETSANLKEGLWEVTMKNDKMPMVISSTVCVGKDGLNDIDKASKAKISSDCEAPKFERSGGKMISDISCAKDGKTTEIHSEMTFSGTDKFNQAMSVKMQGGKDGETTFNQTLDGTFKGACPEGMKVGDVKMNFGK